MARIRPWKPTIRPLIIALGLVALNNLPCRAADDCVVIVNKANPASSIAAADLRKMYLGEKPAWANGTKVTAVTPSPDSPAYAEVIKKTTGMSGADFKRYFIQLSFLGKVVPPPRALESPAAIVHFVGTYAGALGCVPASEAAASVKTLKIE
jgi:hypothetical protein